MTDVADAVTALIAVELEDWPGLPDDVSLADLASRLGFDPEDRRRGDAGDPRRTRLWVPAEAPGFRGGVRIWLEGETDDVVLLECLNPVDAAGDPLPAPDLGEPDAVCEAVLGPFHVADAEQVYADRGLALQVNPDNGVLVGVLAFAPTDVEDYRTRLQPHREPTVPLARPVTR